MVEAVFGWDDKGNDQLVPFPWTKGAKVLMLLHPCEKGKRTQSFPPRKGRSCRAHPGAAIPAGLFQPHRKGAAETATKPLPPPWQCLFPHHFLSGEIKQLSISGKAPALKFSKSCMEL